MSVDPVSASIHIDAKPEDVFRLFTDADGMVAWMGQFARLDPTPGGEMTIDIDGAPMRGRYLELDPPRRLSFSWGFAGSDELPPEASTVEVTFTSEAGGTRVDLVHLGLPPARAERHHAGWARFLPQLQRAARRT